MYNALLKPKPFLDVLTRVKRVVTGRMELLQRLMLIAVIATTAAVSVRAAPVKREADAVMDVEDADEEELMDKRDDDDDDDDYKERSQKQVQADDDKTKQGSNLAFFRPNVVSDFVFNSRR